MEEGPDLHFKWTMSRINRRGKGQKQRDKLEDKYNNATEFVREMSSRL